MNIPHGAIVVGFDGSDEAQRALGWAAEAADRSGRTLVVLNGADQINYAHDYAIGLWTPEAAHEAAGMIAERGVDQVLAEYPDLEVRTATSLASGALALEEASARASLVVVGTRGRGRVLGSLLGSTAFAVSTHAQCPVVVVTGTSDNRLGPEHGIVVGVDGSEGSIAAVEAAVDQALESGAPLRVVSAWEAPPPEPWGPPAGFRRITDATAARERLAVAAVEAAVDHAHDRAPDLAVDSSVIEGRPEDVLADAARGAALLVVGARGRGDFKSLLLGSTSRAVLHQAPCPVYVVR